MLENLTSTQKAYLAGFLDGDGSIYVRAKPNPTYRYGFQIAPYVVLFQSSKESDLFAEICGLVGVGHLRKRSDGILEHIISKADDIRLFLNSIKPYVVLKRRQVSLMLQILERKELIKGESDFAELLGLINSYRELNYSKRRKERTLTP